MSVKNCPICGRVFEDGGVQEVCGICFADNENEFRRVKEYLYQYPNRNIVEVSEATGVSIEKLRRFLRNDRLVAINNNSASLLDCQKCGRPISTGNYCSECQKEIDNELKKGSSAYVGRYKDVKMHTKNTGRR